MKFELADGVEDGFVRVYIPPEGPIDPYSFDYLPDEMKGWYDTTVEEYAFEQAGGTCRMGVYRIKPEHRGEVEGKILVRRLP